VRFLLSGILIGFARFQCDRVTIRDHINFCVDVLDLAPQPGAMTSSRYPESITYQLRGDLARQVRQIHERFAPASGGRLTLSTVVARAVDAGLGIVTAELMAAWEAATNVRKPDSTFSEGA
jgi:hypothetical protein